MDKGIILKAEGLYKSFYQGASELPILKGLSLDVYENDAIAVVGSSGSGKSTLLQILGTLDRPQQGSVFVEGRDVFALSDPELSQLRNEKVGFVFQFHHLLSEFTALENVMLPGLIHGHAKVQAESLAAELLSLLGLKDRITHYPNELSGGELQRVAIARALIRQPRIILADEPTGNLDSANSMKIQEIFFLLKDKFKVSLVVVTHDMQFARRFPRVFRLKDGQWDLSAAPL